MTNARVVLRHLALMASVWVALPAAAGTSTLKARDSWTDGTTAFRNHGFLQGRHQFAVISHRANHVDAPENALQGIRDAIKVGADYVELDLRTTSDGAIVMMHDDTVDRTTDGHGHVRDLTLAQIRAMHFTHPRSLAEPIPTFDEVLDTIGDKVHIYMDIKAVTPQQVLPYLIKHHRERQVIAYCYGPLHVEQWRKGASKIPVIADFDLQSPEQIERDWKAHPFAIFDGPARDLNSDAIATLHRLHVLVWPDIQSQQEGPEQWKKYIDMGVDGFQTDHPGALVDYLEATGVR